GRGGPPEGDEAGDRRARRRRVAPRCARPQGRRRQLRRRACGRRRARARGDRPRPPVRCSRLGVAHHARAGESAHRHPAARRREPVAPGAESNLNHRIWQDPGARGYRHALWKGRDLQRMLMTRPDPYPDGAPKPETRKELEIWVRERLHLPPAAEAELLAAIDAVFTRHERLWQESKHEAIQALSAGFADKLARVKMELSARDATVSSISRYFEALVADLTDKSRRDPKTKLMNFGRFTEQLESFLALEQRGRWCAVGLVDI